MKPFILTILFLAFFQTLFAQTETDIRKHYTEVNSRIGESIELGFEGPLYHNRWVTNHNGRSWPAVGLFTDTTDFWYDDPPDHLPAAERNPKNVLLKVIITRKASHLYSKEEYLYKDGKLLFYYCQQAEEGSDWETRVYYNNKGFAFKTSVKANGKELSAKDFATAEHKDMKPNPVTIMNDAKKYQDLFLKSM